MYIYIYIYRKIYIYVELLRVCVCVCACACARCVRDYARDTVLTIVFMCVVCASKLAWQPRTRPPDGREGGNEGHKGKRGGRISYEREGGQA